MLPDDLPEAGIYTKVACELQETLIIEFTVLPRRLMKIKLLATQKIIPKSSYKSIFSTQT
jgi:hypothetical protein